MATCAQELVLTFLPALVLALLINHFVAQTTYVLGQSMEPNLHDDEHLLIEKLSYRFGTPERGDIVVIDVDYTEIPLIKRIIGLPGEMVQVRDSQLYIDGQLTTEPYLTDTLQRDYGPTTVPEGYVFVMGDNRNNSNDSRYFGAVAVDNILGRAVLLLAVGRGRPGGVRPHGMPAGDHPHRHPWREGVVRASPWWPDTCPWPLPSASRPGDGPRG